MQKYKKIKEKVKEIEFKLGIGYVKTDDRPYKVLRILNVICVVYLLFINTVTLISFGIQANMNNSKISITTFALILVGTVFELAGIILNRVKFHILGNILCILPLPYFTIIFSKMLEHPDGLFGYMSIFYIRYFISYVFIFIFCCSMLFIAIRQQIRIRKLYKRVLNNIYNEYKKKTGLDETSVSDEEFEEFVKNYNPKNQII